MDSPNSESAYSTRGDTSGYTVRVMMPTASIERRLSVKTFWMILSESCFSSLNRHGRDSRFRMINSFHLVPISTTVVATGQVPSRFMRKFICRLRLSEVNRQ